MLLVAEKQARVLGTNIAVPWIPRINRGDQNRKRSTGVEVLPAASLMQTLRLPPGPWIINPPELSHRNLAPDKVYSFMTKSPALFPTELPQPTAEQLPSRKLSRSSSRVKANSRSRSRSIPRSHLSPNDTPNIPFPQSVPHSSYTPSSSADTLARHPTSNNLSPPVPPLPQLPHSSLMQAEHTQSTHAINHSTSNAFNPMAQEP